MRVSYTPHPKVADANYLRTLQLPSAEKINFPTEKWYYTSAEMSCNQEKRQTKVVFAF